MSDVSNAEATALLSQYLFCQDYGDWVSSGAGTGTFTISAGLIDTLGRATPLIGHAAALTVELVCKGESRRAERRYSFSVLKQSRYNVERVYQLGVVQTSKGIKDKHRMPHEHVGNMRNLCPAQAMHWRYDEVLDYFCTRTNITFVPTPRDPFCPT
jgi:hypothetical protein